MWLWLVYVEEARERDTHTEREGGGEERVRESKTERDREGKMLRLHRHTMGALWGFWLCFVKSCVGCAASCCPHDLDRLVLSPKKECLGRKTDRPDRQIERTYTSLSRVRGCVSVSVSVSASAITIPPSIILLTSRLSAASTYITRFNA